MIEAVFSFLNDVALFIGWVWIASMVLLGGLVLMDRRAKRLRRREEQRAERTAEAD